MQDCVNARLPIRASSIVNLNPNPKHVTPQAILQKSVQPSSSSSVPSHSHSYVALLKTCAKLQDYRKGAQIHSEAARMRLVEEDLFVGSAIVNMYAKCGSFVKAWEVFDGLPARNVVSWNALISSYADHGFGEESLKLVEEMMLEGIPPNCITSLSCLKACGILGDIKRGQIMHACIEKKGSMLNIDRASCGKLSHMFHENVGSKRLLDIDQSSVGNSTSTNVPKFPLGETLVLDLDRPSHGHCSMLDIDKASYGKGLMVEHARERSHKLLCNSGKDSCRRDLALGSSNQALGNSLVDMYAKCGCLASAQKVFDKLPIRDVVAWNALLSAYVEHGYAEKALSRVRYMQPDGVSPDSITLACIVKACGQVGMVDRGDKVYAEVKRRGFLAMGSSAIGKALIDMYVKCGNFARAQEVFDELFTREIVIWNALIVGYADHGKDEEALKCFEQMKLEGASPDYITYLSTLKAYGSIGMIEAISGLHLDIEKLGLLSNNPFLGSTLVDVYAKCGCMLKAEHVFNRLHVQNVVSWTALINGNAEQGYSHKALECFQQMQLEGVPPNELTFVGVLKACSDEGAMSKGQEIHVKIDRMGLLANNAILGGALVDMYAKHGLLDKARRAFEKLRLRDVIVWTSLVAGYSESGRCEEALERLEQMRLDGISPDVVAFVCGLKACGASGARDKGFEMHCEVAIKGLSESDIVARSLVDMYARNGLLCDARLLFDKIKCRDVVSWNSLMNGYAQLEESNNVVDVFNRMRGEGMEPDAVTFIILLNMCARAQMIDRSQTFFGAMSEGYGVSPMLGHYSCMADALGHAGQIDEAIAIVTVTDMQRPHLVGWRKILRACKYLGNSGLARLAFQQHGSL